MSSYIQPLSVIANIKVKGIRRMFVANVTEDKTDGKCRRCVLKGDNDLCDRGYFVCHEDTRPDGKNLVFDKPDPNKALLPFLFAEKFWVKRYGRGDWEIVSLNLLNDTATRVETGEMYSTRLIETYGQKVQTIEEARDTVWLA